MCLFGMKRRFQICWGSLSLVGSSSLIRPLSRHETLCVSVCSCPDRDARYQPMCDTLDALSPTSRGFCQSLFRSLEKNILSDVCAWQVALGLPGTRARSVWLFDAYVFRPTCSCARRDLSDEHEDGECCRSVCLCRDLPAQARHEPFVHRVFKDKQKVRVSTNSFRTSFMRLVEQ